MTIHLPYAKNSKVPLCPIKYHFPPETISDINLVTCKHCIKIYRKKFALSQVTEKSSEKTETEIWKTIPKFPCFEASNLGRIRNKETQKIRALFKPPDGGYLISLNRPLDHNRWTTATVSSCIWEAFNGEKPRNTFVIHENKILTDNNIKNLILRKTKKHKNAKEESKPQPIVEEQKQSETKDIHYPNKTTKGFSLCNISVVETNTKFSHLTCKKCKNLLKEQSPWFRFYDLVETTEYQDYHLP